MEAVSNPEFWRIAVVSFAAALCAIIPHEIAHGLAAWALGDDTAKRLGRLSLNPLRHIDRFGTILLPAALALVQLATIRKIVFMFGWAKPVPVNAFRFRHPRQEMALVAAAGPATNFILAWLAALTGHLVGYLPEPGGVLLAQFLDAAILVNLALGLFNLLPLPPLDGGRIIVGVLPAGLALRWAKVERVGILVVLLGVFLLPQGLRAVGIDFDPVGATLMEVIPRAERLVLYLAGYGV